jgi:hypothetical protein
VVIATPNGPTEGLLTEDEVGISQQKYYIHIMTDYPALQPYRTVINSMYPTNVVNNN